MHALCIISFASCRCRRPPCRSRLFPSLNSFFFLHFTFILSPIHFPSTSAQLRLFLPLSRIHSYSYVRSLDSLLFSFFSPPLFTWRNGTRELWNVAMTKKTRRKYQSAENAYQMYDQCYSQLTIDYSLRSNICPC